MAGAGLVVCQRLPCEMGSGKLRLNQKRSRDRESHAKLYLFQQADIRIMSIEIRQLNIKSNVLQSGEGTENTAASASKPPHAGASACAGPQLLTEEARPELMNA